MLLTRNLMPVTVFKRLPLYTKTYNEKVLPNSALRKKFRDFMELKRNDPYASFGSSDKPFAAKASFQNAVPGLKHAHITYDISIVYRVEGNVIYLYGFFTHDELGTGQPANQNRQKSMSARFANQPVPEESTALSRLKSLVEYLLKI